MTTGCGCGDGYWASSQKIMDINTSMRRPDSGFGHYLRDIVYGALDGVVTTMAVVTGASGASLSPRIGLVLGIANVVADGFSMGASNYLGLKSELEQRHASVEREAPWRHGLATWAAFTVAGGIPLISYGAAAWLRSGLVLPVFVLSMTALGAVGVVRARFVRQRPWRSAVEVMVVGASAAAAAFVAGGMADAILQ